MIRLAPSAHRVPTEGLCFPAFLCRRGPGCLSVSGAVAPSAPNPCEIRSLPRERAQTDRGMRRSQMFPSRSIDPGGGCQNPAHPGERRDPGFLENRHVRDPALAGSACPLSPRRVRSPRGLAFRTARGESGRGRAARFEPAPPSPQGVDAAGSVASRGCPSVPAAEAPRPGAARDW